jgi:RNA polymerase sigma-70 factor (ECF subfamily)
VADAHAPVITIAGVDDPDAAAFAKRIGPHWVTMYRLAVGLCGAADADDVLQDALSTAWRKRHQFNPDRGSELSWLLAIVANQGRKNFRRPGPPVIELTDAVASVDDRTAPVDLHRAVRRLSARQRTAVSLHYYLDLPVAEVAVVMGCSVGTVKSTLSDARSRLRTLLGDDY